MCAITGIAGARDVESARRAVEAAVDTLRHRGPDDRGVWAGEGGMVLGHARLSILDLSPTGHQPMLSPDGNDVLVFNGEVYNFREIRAELERRGHRFRGRGDTEVVLAALREWDVAALDRFIGMFALGWWNVRRRRLVLVRDRLGVKPLYWSGDGRTLVFASELRALHAFDHWTPRIDRTALGEFFHYGYISSPRSIFEGVCQLDPGHVLEWSPGRAPRTRRYWDPLSARVDVPADENEAVDALESLLADACRRRLVADVPVGVFLSGGIDSSTVAALLCAGGERPSTFTIGFRERRHDESAYARAVADHLGTVHTSRILDVDRALELLRDWGELFDEPFADASGLPTLLVSRVASERVKVVLSADGGDELFSGYSVYDDIIRRWRALSRTPRGVRRAAGAFLSPLVGAMESVTGRPGGESAAARVGNARHRLARLRHALSLDGDGVAGVHDAAIAYWLPDEVRRLLGGYEPPREDADAWGGDVVDRLCRWDLRHYLPGDILTKVDRTTMRVSIEGRVPLLDHRVVEFALATPVAWRRGALGPKHLLKRVLYRHVPREIVDRPKQGFRIPLDEWLRGPLRGELEARLDPRRLREAGVLDADAAHRVVRAYRSGDRRRVTQVWFLLAFEMWRERWYGARSAPQRARG